jgi:hypothetical protein
VSGRGWLEKWLALRPPGLDRVHRGVGLAQQGGGVAPIRAMGSDDADAGHHMQCPAMDFERLAEHAADAADEALQGSAFEIADLQGDELVAREPADDVVLADGLAWMTLSPASKAKTRPMP